MLQHSARHITVPLLFLSSTIIPVRHFPLGTIKQTPAVRVLQIVPNRGQLCSVQPHFGPKPSPYGPYPYLRSLDRSFVCRTPCRGKSDDSWRGQIWLRLVFTSRGSTCHVRWKHCQNLPPFPYFFFLPLLPVASPFKPGRENKYCHATGTIVSWLKDRVGG